MKGKESPLNPRSRKGLGAIRRPLDLARAVKDNNNKYRMRDFPRYARMYSRNQRTLNLEARR